MKVTAFGGGHGLAAMLRALRLLRGKLDLELTAVVTVGDDGGSSGRLRADRGGLPPGDLRQALAALADPDDPVAERTAALLQHRFAGTDPLAGHAVGNLLLCGLMELAGDPVVALDHARILVHAVGRVLPMSRIPLSIEAVVRGADPHVPDRLTVVRGQHAVAVTAGVVEDVRLHPTESSGRSAADPPGHTRAEAEPAACAEAVAATLTADWLLFGPGSWYTSVIPHLLVPDLARAILASPARRLVTLNLAVELETAGLSLPDHLRALARYLPGLRVDVVLADGNPLAIDGGAAATPGVRTAAPAADDPIGLQAAAQSLGARVVLAPVAVADGGPRHDPVALANALHEVLAGVNWGQEVTTRWP
jgi:uncharacterized cofD-like protein